MLGSVDSPEKSVTFFVAPFLLLLRLGIEAPVWVLPVDWRLLRGCDCMAKSPMQMAQRGFEPELGDSLK